MNDKNVLIVFWALVTLPILLIAAPQDLDTFYDFEDAEGGGTFTIGEPPNSIRVINFNVETVEDTNLTHSGSKALVLIPGNEGLIEFERGVNLLQFYAADPSGGGRIEIIDDIKEISVYRGIVHGLAHHLPRSINSRRFPPLQRFVAFRGGTIASSFRDLNFFNGIKSIRVYNVSGQFSLDDLGFTYIEGPSNNTVFSNFELTEDDQQFYYVADRLNFTLGESPYSATFTGGSVRIKVFVEQLFEPLNHTYPAFNWTGFWLIRNDTMGTITFETPAAKVQFYAAVLSEGDGEISVYDAKDNLLTSTTDIPLNINPLLIDDAIPFFSFIAEELGAQSGIGKITYSNKPAIAQGTNLDISSMDDFGFTPIGAPGSGTEGPPPAEGPSIATQPTSQEVALGASASLSVDASGDDRTYQWFTGNSGDITNPVAGAIGSTLETGVLIASTNFWVQITNAGGSANSDTAVITVAAPPVSLVLDGSGAIAGENIQHPNGNIINQVLLTGESIQLQARPNQITRVSFMDLDEDIVQVEFSGAGTFTVILDPVTFLPATLPPRYNQAVEYVTGKPSVVIDGANANTFFSIFTVGRINAVNQALFPEGQDYDAQADVTLVEVVNSTGIGGMQLSNTVFSGSTGNVGVDARGVSIAVRLTIGDIDASGDAVPHLLFGEGSFTIPAGNTGLRITGGDLAQTNGASIVVAESGSTTTGFENTFITQNNFKSDNTPQPTQNISATFANEDGEEINVSTSELTIE